MTLILSGTNGVSDIDGDASTPAIRGTDANSGIFFGADQVGVATNGVERVEFGNSETVFNDGGADVDFRVEGDTQANLLFVDASADAVGIGTATPATYGDANTRLAVVNATSGTADVNIRWGTNDVKGIVFCNDVSGAGLGIGSTTNAYFGFLTNGTERARITSGGLFKAGNLAPTSAGPAHEFTLSGNLNTLYAINTNASNTQDGVLLSACARTASSAYDITSFWSGNGSTGYFNDAEFRFRGDGNGYADGTWNNNGADYAEFFESANGQALTLGATVVLDGNKVREATDQDPATSIIGVVRPKEPSKASMVVGNTAWNKWANKYLTDDFDRYIMEDHDVVEWTDEDGKEHSYESQSIPAGITVPANATRKTHDDKGNKFQHYKLNPAWNPDSEYVNRENRPEWNIIGLLGQVKTLKGQPVGDRWIKMRDVSETVEEWMIR